MGQKGACSALSGEGLTLGTASAERGGDAVSLCRARIWLAGWGGVRLQTPLEGGVPQGHLPWPASSGLGIGSQAVQVWGREAAAGPSCKIAGSWALRFGVW